ncbi:MAG: GntR family transcriptional regulator [Beijerinckiaceae bacterium]
MPLTLPVHASPSAEERVPASERAYQALKKLIMNNDFPAGTQILELEAAARLGMSRTPVREAMVRLEQEGVVALRPRHGMRVLPLSARDMAEIYEILTALESAAAETVARRGLTPDELAALNEAVVDMDIALDADDLLAWSAADERFHRLLVNHSGNRRLIGIVEQVWDQAHRARIQTLRMRPKPVTSNRDHRALVEAIQRRDARAARVIHENHRRKATSMLVDLLERLGIKQI